MTKLANVALVALGLAALLVVGALVVASLRGPTRADVAGYQPPLSTPVRPAVDFLGDSITGGSEMGGVGPTNYTTLLGERFGWRVGNRALGGTGYTLGVPEQPAFGGPGQVEKVTADRPSLIVVAGGRNDATRAPGEVYTAATRLYEGLRSARPDAKIVVVGIIWSSADVPTSVRSTDIAIRSAAEAQGIPFISAIGEGWFAGPYERLIGSDRTHPTDEGHAHIAEVLGRDLEDRGLNPAAAGGR